MFSDLRGDVVGECFSRPEAVGNIHALLPALKFLPIQLLHASELLEFLDFIVSVIEVEIAEIIDVAGELLPRTLPFKVALLPPGPPETCSGAWLVPATARLRPRRTGRGRPHLILVLLLILVLVGELKEIAALYAVPVTIWDVVQTQTVCVVVRIAAVAEEQDVLPLRGIANRAWARFLLLFLDVLAQPLLKVELGNLFLVLDVVRGNGGS